MLHEICQSVLEAKTVEEFRREIVTFAHGLGFVTISALTVLDHEMGQPEFIVVDNAPEAFRPLRKIPGDQRRDPVMQHCKNSSRPIIWDQSTYVQNGQADLWEQQSQFGYCTGVALALHLPEGRHFVCGVERDKPLPKDAVELTRMMADLQLFAVHAQEVAARVLLPATIEKEVLTLTPRELEALRWTMEGKTAWEVGKILNIAERTAVFHISNAMRKLQCATKHQAAIKAQRLGFLR